MPRIDQPPSIYNTSAKLTIRYCRDLPHLQFLNVREDLPWSSDRYCIPPHAEFNLKSDYVGGLSLLCVLKRFFACMLDFVPLEVFPMCDIDYN